MLYTSAEKARGPDLIRSQSWNWSVASSCVYRISQRYNQQMLKSSLKTNKDKHSVSRSLVNYFEVSKHIVQNGISQDNKFQIFHCLEDYKPCNLPLYHWKISKYFFAPPQNQNSSQNRDPFQKINSCACLLVISEYH